MAKNPAQPDPDNQVIAKTLASYCILTVGVDLKVLITRILLFWDYIRRASLSESPLSQFNI